MTRAWVLAIAALVAGCSLDESLAPATIGAHDAGPSDAGLDASPTTPDAGSVKRTIVVRSPLGGNPNDYLADGDFELSTSAFPDAQTPWRSFIAATGAAQSLLTETGGLCRSGLRCAILRAGDLFLGRGAAADGKENVAAVHAKMLNGAPCDDVFVGLVSCADLKTMHALTTSATPDADGWCTFSGRLAATIHSVCLVVEAKSGATPKALIDEARLGPDDGTVNPESVSTWVPDEALVASLARIRPTIERLAPRPRPRTLAEP